MASITINFAVGNEKDIPVEPENDKAYLNRGLEKSNLGDYEGAIADYNKAILINPNYYDAYLNRGNAKSYSGDKVGAISDYEEAININPNYADAFNNRGNVKKDFGDFEGAISDYTQAIFINPSLSYTYNNRGLAKSDLGDYDGAIADYNQAILINPSYADAFMNRGIAKSSLRDDVSAICDHNEAINLNPDYDRAYYNRGNAKSNIGDYEGAISDYNKAINFSPKFIYVLLNRGLAHLKLGDYEGAIADFTQAIIINPSYANGFVFRGITKLIAGDYENALNDCKDSLTLASDHLYAQALHIVLELLNSNKPVTISELVSILTSISNQSDFIEGWLEILGHLFENRFTKNQQPQDLVKAIEIYELALDYGNTQNLQELQATARNRLGAYYVSEGKWYEGLAQLQLCLDYYRQTDNLERRADLLTQIARVQLLLGDWDKARMLYRDALRIYEHLDKKVGIANCHLALGRMMLRLNYSTEAQKELETASTIFTECGMSDRQAETAEVLEVISQFQSKQALKI